MNSWIKTEPPTSTISDPTALISILLSMCGQNFAIGLLATATITAILISEAKTRKTRCEMYLYVLRTTSRRAILRRALR